MRANPACSAPSTTTAGRASDRQPVAHLQQSELFRNYRDAFETTTGLPLALRPAGSLQSPLLASRQANSFCRLMSTRNPSCAACLRLQQRFETEATEGTTTLECYAGLNETAAPIRVGDQVLGHLQTGQVLLQKPTARRFAAIARQLKTLGVEVDLTQLEAAYYRTRVMDRHHYEASTRLMSVFAQHLATVTHQVATRESAGESPVIVKAREFLARNYTDNISLADVARAVHMSSFHFCKLFKKATGLTFTAYLARLRVERVKEMLLNPHMRISEAAFATGFQSLSQFNRVFRDLAGESPSTYRERLHGRSSAPVPAANIPLPRAA